MNGFRGLLLFFVMLLFAPLMAFAAEADPSKWGWIFETVKYLYENYGEVIVGLNALLAVAIAISLIIPGEQPEKFLKGVVLFLKKFSVKGKK